jgi:VanZ family protein
MKILKVAAWLLVIGLLIITVVPAAERPETDLQHDFEHFLAFALAGTAVALAYPSRVPVLVPAAFAFTLVLEMMQIPLATRHARVEDFAVDALGACGAIVTVYLARYIWRRNELPSDDAAREARRRS